jgi:hypothetical protein
VTVPPVLARAGPLAPALVLAAVARWPVARPGRHGLPAEPGTGAPAGRPVIMIVVHGTLAASTILLVVLAAAGAS